MTSKTDLLYYGKIYHLLKHYSTYYYVQNNKFKNEKKNYLRKIQCSSKKTFLECVI